MAEPARIDFTKIGEEALSALYRDRTVVETSSAAFDPDSQMQSTSPYVGDVASTFLFVPQAATTQLDGRYLFRLAALAVPPYGRARIMGLRTHLTIGQPVRVTSGRDVWTYVEEFPVVTPGWSFKDGNVSYHLRVLRGPSQDRTSSLVLPPGQSTMLYGMDSSLLVAANNPRYVAPNGGLPPGQAVGSLGTFRDQRFPWNRQGAETDLGYEVDGPAIVGLYASVWQTDPATRIQLPAANVPTDVGALCPEERFLLAWGDSGGEGGQNFVAYRHIGGALIAELSQKMRSDMHVLPCG